MCKNECRWDSLKEGITLHISLISEKVHLLNFFSNVLVEKRKQFLVGGSTRQQLPSSISYKCSMFKYVVSLQLSITYCLEDKNKEKKSGGL